mgnify:CR=1 FL=1
MRRMRMRAETFLLPPCNAGGSLAPWWVSLPLPEPRRSARRLRACLGQAGGPAGKCFALLQGRSVPKIRESIGWWRKAGASSSEALVAVAKVQEAGTGEL